MLVPERVSRDHRPAAYPENFSDQKGMENDENTSRRREGIQTIWGIDLLVSLKQVEKILICYSIFDPEKQGGVSPEP